jgi:hypothetical protein
MRPELELIEKIEDFLKGRLSAEEMAAFRKLMAADPELQEKVRLQQDVMKGLERASLTQKVKYAGRSFHYGKAFRKWGWGGAATAVVVTSTVLLFNYWKGQNHSRYDGSLSLYNESGKKEFADADRKIASQVFSIDGSRDTVIETKGGITFSIPANGFLDENGKPVNGAIQVSVKEALDAGTIMKSGLSTQSEGRLLETGGMFYIDARTANNILKIDPAKGIYAGVPTDTIKRGMQVFKGKRMADGNIDWVNPKPISHDLTTVDIKSLNFYPPFYLDSLRSWGYDITNKEFTDSLYYSFASLFNKADSSSAKPVAVDSEKKSDTSIYQDGNFHGYSNNDLNGCGINPVKIKAIWSGEFQNTFIATREFEERLVLIHEIKNPTILDLYVNNLDKNIYELDSMAAQLVGGEEGDDLRFRSKIQFLRFADRRDGNVKNNSPQFQKLREYYQKKTKAYTEAITKTQKKFWDRQRQLDQAYSQKSNQYRRDSLERINQNFEEEFNTNLKDVYHQLGYDTTDFNKPIMQPIYGVVVTNTGWNNVDKYVFEATEGRKDMSYTDPETGKTATLKYNPLEVNIVNASQYDQVYVYLLPNKLTSYMRINGTGGKFSENLNGLMTYDLVCIGYKGKQALLYSKKEINPGTYSVELIQTDQRQLDRELKRSGPSSQIRGIRKEIEFMKYEIKDRIRQQKNESIYQLWHRIEPFIVCGQDMNVSNDYIGPESITAPDSTAAQ